MRAYGIVVAPPVFDHDLRLLERVEDLAFQQFILELAVEALAVPVLPRAAGFDVQGLGAELCQPLPQSLGDHLRTVVAPNMLGHAFGWHGICKRLDYPEAVDPPRHLQGQALAGVLVDEGHDPEAPSIMGSALDEVEAPHVIGSLGPQPDAGAVVEPEPASGSVLLRDLEPFTAPDALNPIPAHAPARDLQQGGDPPVAVAAVLGGKGHDRSGECILVSSEGGHIALRPTWLA